MNLIAIGKKPRKAYSYAVTQRDPSWSFSGRFFVDGEEGALTVSQGFVNGLEPVMPNGKLISGSATEPQPVLSQKFPYGQDGRCYICLQLLVDPATGIMQATSQEMVNAGNLTIAVVPSFVSTNAALHYHPIAIARKDDGITQIAFGDFLHDPELVNGIVRQKMFSC